MQQHEYSIIGHDRALIGRYIGMGVGVLMSASATTVLVGLELAQQFGIVEHVPPVVLLPLTIASFYAFGFWIFNKFAWRLSFILKVMNVPNLNGTWNCRGETLEEDGSISQQWDAIVTITQTWEKIAVRLRTERSDSYSVSAAIVKDPAGGFRLMYSYRSDPRIGQGSMRPHRGYCELDVADDGQSASGDYFNNKGRITFGRMTLTRRS